MDQIKTQTHAWRRLKIFTREDRVDESAHAVVAHEDGNRDPSSQNIPEGRNQKRVDKRSDRITKENEERLRSERVSNCYHRECPQS